MKESEVNNFYIIPEDKKQTDKIAAQLRNILGKDYSVKNVLQQQSVYFRIVKSEKLAVYIILSLIIFIATINIVSTIIILNIQKYKMNNILRAIGTTVKDLRKIYFGYGMMINILGCLFGIILGIILCIVQQQFGIIKLANNSFVVDAFPVKILFKDIIIVLIIVLLIGGLSVRMITSRLKVKN
jgi:ABC-type lipoprotein release transport system permease subunit